MLALGLANLVGAVLFAAIYAAAGARYLSQGAFVTCLVLMFGLATTLWIRTESRHAALGFVARVGRAALALIAILVVVPVAALLPFFWLESALPPEAGMEGVLAPVMALVLIALALVAAMNVVGGLVQGGYAIARRLGRGAGSPAPDGS
jgi:hypothetical protein